jgi:hypothetical protein
VLVLDAEAGGLHGTVADVDAQEALENGGSSWSKNAEYAGFPRAVRSRLRRSANV